MLSDSNYQGGSKRWRVSPSDRQWPSNFLHIKDVAGAGGLQMLIDGAGQVWAKNTIGYGGWTRETPRRAQGDRRGAGGLQMLLDSAGQVWAKNTIGDGGWTRETPGGHTRSPQAPVACRC